MASTAIRQCRATWASSLVSNPGGTGRSMITLITAAPSLLPQQITRHDHPHHLVRALEDLVHAQVAHDAFDAVIRKIAVSAVQLQRVVGHLEASVGDEPFRHGA